ADGAAHPPSRGSAKAPPIIEASGAATNSSLPRLMHIGELFLALGFGIFGRLGLYHAPHVVPVRSDPVGLRDPFAAVPHLDAGFAAPAVVLRGHGDGSNHVVGVVVLDAFKTILDLLGRQRPAILLDGEARAFNGDRPDRKAGVVVDVLEVFAVAVSFALVVEFLDDLLDHGMVGPAGDVGAALDALGRLGADVVDIDFVHPVDGDIFVERNAVALHLA